MKKQPLFKLTTAIGTFTMALSACAIAGETHNQVPTSAEAWFKAGNQAVLVNKSNAPALRRAKNVIFVCR